LFQSNEGDMLVVETHLNDTEKLKIFKELFDQAFYSIYRDGNCDYVFKGDHEAFKGMKKMNYFQVGVLILLKIIRIE
jgi:hypothetical protein